jgi:hypothetical protein
MKSGVSVGLLSIALALVASTPSAPLRAAGAGLKPPPKAEHCQANVSTYNYRKGDADFAKVAADLNREFLNNVDVRKSVKIAEERRPIVPADAETLRIQIETVQCASNKRGANLVTTQCNYVGCVGDLGPAYENLPEGSEVSIGVCSGGVQTVSNYRMNGQGQWVMTGYKTEQVDQCSPMG